MLSRELMRELSSELSSDLRDAIRHEREVLFFEIRESQDIIERCQEQIRRLDELLAGADEKV